MEFHQKIALAFVPAIIIDWLTSFLGVLAIFSVNTPLSWLVALVLSGTALVVNFLTTQIFAETGGHRELWLSLWFLCIAYDSYTTWVGLANMAGGAGFFTIKTMNFLELIFNFSIEVDIALIVASAILVISPMLAYREWEKGAVRIPN